MRAITLAWCRKNSISRPLHANVFLLGDFHFPLHVVSILDRHVRYLHISHDSGGVILFFLSLHLM